MAKLQRQICSTCDKDLPTVAAANDAPEILYVAHCKPRTWVDALPRGTAKPPRITRVKTEVLRR